MFRSATTTSYHSARQTAMSRMIVTTSPSILTTTSEISHFCRPDWEGWVRLSAIISTAFGIDAVSSAELSHEASDPPDRGLSAAKVPKGPEYSTQTTQIAGVMQEDSLRLSRKKTLARYGRADIHLGYAECTLISNEAPQLVANAGARGGRFCVSSRVSTLRSRIA